MFEVIFILNINYSVSLSLLLFFFKDIKTENIGFIFQFCPLRNIYVPSPV